MPKCISFIFCVALLLSKLGSAGDESIPVRCRGLVELGKAGAGPLKMPSLQVGLEKKLNITRPPRSPVAPLPDFSNQTNFLPREVLTRIVFRISNSENWRIVSRSASGHRTIEDKLRASWARDDAAAEVSEYLAQLNQIQRQIAWAAYRGAMEEKPATFFPEQVSLEWVQQNLPPRPNR